MGYLTSPETEPTSETLASPARHKASLNTSAMSKRQTLPRAIALAALLLFCNFGGLCAPVSAPLPSNRDAALRTMEKLGTVVQRARGCGVPELEMKGARRSYNALIELADVEYQDPEMAEALKALLATSPESKAAFSAAVQAEAAKGRAAPQECSRVLSIWPEVDRRFDKSATGTYQNIEAIKAVIRGAARH